MNDNNFKEGNTGFPFSDSESSSADNGTNDASTSVTAPAAPVSETYSGVVAQPASHAQEDGFRVPPEQPFVKPDAPIQPPTPPQRPQTPVQNGYRPMQNGYYQPPGTTYNPYVTNTSANRNGGYPNPNPYQQYNPQGPIVPPQPPRRSSGKNIAIILIAVCAVIAIICIAIGMVNFDGTQGNETDTTASTGTTQSSGNSTTNLNPETTVNDSMNVSTTAPSQETANSVYVAQKVRPSVVGVMTYYDGELTGEGSGVLMSEKDGWTYIITCAHVINEENVEYRILFLDGSTLEAELVAYDDRTDIGVVKVNKTGLPLAEFGDSSSLLVGEPIYAVGNPGGSEYFGSITDGIIASIDRSVTSTYTMTCIQHNAAINPGNSGGALVNSSGQVIGINSAKIASMEFEGMGFAVPTSIAGPVVDALINYGYVPNRPKLGIEYAPVSSYQLYSIIVSVRGLPQGSLVIASIAEDSSLIGTDAQVGDLIIGVNGKEMTDSSVLLDLIETGSVGDSITLNLARINNRNYSVETFDVVITLVEDKGN